MANLHGPVLTDDELATFQEQGYVRLGKVAPDAEIEALCRRASGIIEADERVQGIYAEISEDSGS